MAALSVERQDKVWTITLQRGEKRNALSAELVEQLIEAVSQAHAQQAEVIVFRGAGRNFSAGFDFSESEQLSEGDLLLRFVRVETLLQLVAGSPCLTLALAHGKNFGAGVDLFAVCRQRVASADASFRMPGLKFGLVLGTRRFGALVGPGVAARVLERSATFGAEEALAMGFVDRIVEPGGWEQLVTQARETSSALSAESRALLYRALATDHADTDLATLVRSAAQPGLKDRVARYLAG